MYSLINWGSSYWEDEVCIGGAEATGRGVAVEQVGLVVEGFVSEEDDFEVDPSWDKRSVEFLE